MDKDRVLGSAKVVKVVKVVKVKVKVAVGGIKDTIRDA